MKKLTFLALAALAAGAANAQYTTETPYANETVKEGVTAIYDLIVASQDVVDGLTAAGQTVNIWALSDPSEPAMRHLYIWDQTFVGGDGSFPGVGYNDYQFDGYTDLNVSNKGWSGAGFFIGTASHTSTEHWNDQTRLHMSLRSTNAPASIGFTVCDPNPAKFAVGDPFADNSGNFPSVAPKLTAEWMGIDISFADLKKLWPSFEINATADYDGNILAFLAGGVQGQNLGIDCLFFYTPSNGGGVIGVADEAADMVVTSNTINAAGAATIELYDLSGRMVKSVNGSVMNIDELGNGLYVAKAGKSVKKIMK